MTETAAVTHSLVLEREFPHAPEKVWRALTESNLIEQWLMANDFEPRVGRAFQLRATPAPGWNGLIEGEVLAVEPPRMLAYTWSSMGLRSTVSFTLTATAAGTHLRLEQTGFPTTDSPYYKGASYGWKGFLGKLEPVVAGLE